MSKIQTVIFDMDGLMFDTESLYFESNQITLENMGYHYTPDMYLEILGTSGEEFYNGMLKVVETDDNYQRFIEIADEYFLERISSGDVEVKPGLYELVDYLNKIGVKRYVASSSYRHVIDILLEKADLADEFHGIVSGDSVTHSKPHPEPYLTAWKDARTEKEKTWVLEDSVTGLKAADRAELPAVLVPDLITPDEEAEKLSQVILTDLNEVKDYFDYLTYK